MNKPVATKEEFERLAEVMLDLARVDYIGQPRAQHRLMVLGRLESFGVQEYRFGAVPLDALDTLTTPAEVVLSALLTKLVQMPGVLVVGFVGEARMEHITLSGDAQQGEQLASQDEVLLLTMRSADCRAIAPISLTRDGRKTQLGSTELNFDVPQPGSERSSLH